MAIRISRGRIAIRLEKIRVELQMIYDWETGDLDDQDLAEFVETISQLYKLIARLKQ